MTTWKPPIRDTQIHCPRCGTQMTLIDENRNQTWTIWNCTEHGAWEAYHPYPVFRLEKWPRSR